MKKLTIKNELGKTGLKIPPIIFGTSCLGNLYQALPDETKLAIMKQWFECVDGAIAADSAGKYGAGLALEVMGQGLKKLGIKEEQILISNKLAWLRTPLLSSEPTFEPGAWKNLKHDAEQKISYDGILECWEQGCKLLGGKYQPQLISVHDPDEYLVHAKNPKEKKTRFNDVLGAYKALSELKKNGKVKAVGIGAKNWEVIREISEKVELDWVMLAVSFTIMKHPPELLSFIEELNRRKIGIINSAVFHAGFLTGGDYFDYRKVSPSNPDDKHLFEWREKFVSLCRKHSITASEACVRFAMTPPGVVSISLNTSKPERVADNVALVQAEIPGKFWDDMKNEGLIEKNYKYV